MEQQFNIQPSGDAIGADVYGIDVSQPLSEATFTALEEAFHTHEVLCLRQQRLTEPAFIAFAERFGEVEKIFLTHYAHPQYPEILFVSNIKENGHDIGHADAGRVWHSDMSYTARPPRATLLYALEVPMEHGEPLGATNFASARAAYESLPAATQARLEGLRVVHHVAGRRKQTGTGQQDQAQREQQPAVVHPFVRTHPFTGRKSLYVNRGECVAIDGMEQDAALALIAEMADLVPQPPFRHVHRWQVGDLLMWDNCSVQHLATFDYQWPQHRRLMHRITVGGSATW
jgi:taurine dioxygenase